MRSTQGATSFRIRGTWSGEPVGPGEQVDLRVALGSEVARVEIDAPFHDDPPPPGPPGSHPGLFEFEVVELFLVGADEQALEIEVGPHGHHWVLDLRGPRNALREGLPVDLEVALDRPRGRWMATVSFSSVLLPAGLDRANAYAIHGVGEARRYLAAHPVPGDGPDFHRFDAFPRWEPS